MSPPPDAAKADDFESRFMSGAGALLHRSKRSSSIMAGGLLALALVMAVVGVLTTVTPGPAWVPLLMFANTLLFAFCGLGLSVVRTTVTSAEVNVKMGLWGPRVPIAAIESCRVVPYAMMEFGGWGIKRSGDGTWAYTLSPSDPVVELTWREGGSVRKAVWSAADPELVASEIQRARALGAASAGGVRIEPAVDAETETEAEAEDPERQIARERR